MSLEEQKTRSFNYCFAGVDKDAVDAARQHMFPFLHRQLWLLKNGLYVERHHIEGRGIAENKRDKGQNPAIAGCFLFYYKKINKLDSNLLFQRQ
jgi:hypothetical protein